MHICWKAQGLWGHVEEQTQGLFLANESSADVGAVWDMFKAFIRGIFIPFKAHRDKNQNAFRNRLIDKIHRLEELNIIENY